MNGGTILVTIVNNFFEKKSLQIFLCQKFCLYLTIIKKLKVMIKEIKRLEDRLAKTTDPVSAVILQLKINRLKKLS